MRKVTLAPCQKCKTLTVGYGQIMYFNLYRMVWPISDKIKSSQRLGNSNMKFISRLCCIMFGQMEMWMWARPNASDKVEYELFLLRKVHFQMWKLCLGVFTMPRLRGYRQGCNQHFPYVLRWNFSLIYRTL